MFLRRGGPKGFVGRVGRDALRKHGAMDYTTVIVAGASAPAPLQVLGSLCWYSDGRALHV